MTIALITNTDFTDFTDAAYKECLSQSTSAFYVKIQMF